VIKTPVLVRIANVANTVVSQRLKIHSFHLV